MFGINSNKKVTREREQEAWQRHRDQIAEKKTKLAEARQARYEVALELRKAEDQKRFTGKAPENLSELRSRYAALDIEVKRYGG